MQDRPLAAGARPKVPGYEVLAPLGEGATSRVWRARREADGLGVALKVVHPVAGKVEAGLREAGLLARLRHTHLVHLYDVVPVPDLATGRTVGVALAMQLASGGSLGQLLARRRMLSPGEVVTVLSPICSVLAELHGEGVVHGDLSVGNVVFLDDGMPLLADLGAGRIVGDRRGELHGTDAASGMVAPEVLEGFAPGREADVYAVGALAWLCLVGEPPGPAFARPPLAERSPELPEAMVQVVEQALAAAPEDRPDADEIVAALAEAARPEPVEVAPDTDPVHGLTERLRQQAREDAEDEPAAPVGAWGRLRSRLGRAPSPRRAEHRRPPGEKPPGAHRARPDSRSGPRGGPRGGGPGRGVLVGALVGLAAVLSLVLAGLGSGLVPTPWGASAAPPAPSSPQEVAAAPPAAPVPEPSGADPSATTSAATAGPDASATTSDPTAGPDASATTSSPEEADVVELLQALVDVRGEAWEQADAERLTAAMAQGSPALVAEARDLGDVVASGVTYPDVTFRVEGASVVDSGAEQDRMTVEAVVSRAPLVAYDQDGRRSHSPMRTDEVVIVLAKDGGSWRLWSWDLPGAPDG